MTDAHAITLSEAVDFLMERHRALFGCAPRLNLHDDAILKYYFPFISKSLVVQSARGTDRLLAVIFDPGSAPPVTIEVFKRSFDLMLSDPPFITSWVKANRSRYDFCRSAALLLIFWVMAMGGLNHVLNDPNLSDEEMSTVFFAMRSSSVEEEAA